MKTIVNFFEVTFAALPLALLEVWGRFAFGVGLLLAIAAFGGFTFRLGEGWGLGRERQAWDAKAFLSIPLTFLLIVLSGYLGSFIVLVPGAQTLESLKDLVVFLCVVLFGYPALITVPFAYGLSDLVEGVPPDFLWDWLPGYFINPACFWIAYQLIGRDPDFRRGRTWLRYVLFVVVFLSLEPVLWGYICSEKFTPEISYRAITPALFFTTGLTWAVGPLAMVAALPLARRFRLFWAEIPGHVQERTLRGETAWEAGRGTISPTDGRGEPVVPLRMVLLAPFIALVLLMVAATAYVSLRSAERDANQLASRLHEEIAENLNLRLDEYFATRGDVPEAALHDDLGRLLARLPIAGHGRAFVIDGRGHLVASSGPAGDLVVTQAIASRPPDPGPDAPARWSFDHVTAKPLSRVTWLAQAAAYRDPQGGHRDWILMTVMPESFFLAGVRTGHRRSAMVLAVALLLSLGVAAVLASVVTAPLRRLSDATRTLAGGEVAAPVPVSRLEELNALAQGFNRMAQQLQASFGALQSSEQRLQLAVRGARVGIWDWDVEKDELLWDDSMYRLYDVERDEFGGAYDAWRNRLLPEDVARATADVQAALRGEREFVSEFRVRRRDGSIRVIRGLGQTIHEGGRARRMVGVNWDVTDQLATLALREAKEQADSASRAKSAFLAHMSHEIRTPLNAVLGFAQLLQRSPTLPAADRDYVQDILRAGNHLLDLVNDVLDMAKIEAGRMTVRPATFDLHGLLRDLETLVGGQAGERRLQFDVERRGRLPRRLTLDEGKLRQILVNVAGNAVKFTAEGRVVLRVEMREADGEPRLVIEVEDTGPGIAAGELSRVFEPFEQTAAGATSQQGTGLGMSLSRACARLMGGDLTVRSEVGVGTLFRLELPCAVAEGEEAPDLPAPDAIGLEDASDLRVLVVDDKTDNRRVIVALLASAGIPHRQASDGEEAIAVWQAWRPQLVLMDMRMPVMDGYEATRRIKAAGEPTKVIAVTASAFDQDVDEILGTGADALLMKPFRANDLFAKMAAVTGLALRYAAAGLPAPETATPDELTADRLSALGAERRDRMREAVLRADSRSLVKLIDEIAADHPALAQQLGDLAERYEYDRLTQLLR